MENNLSTKERLSINPWIIVAGTVALGIVTVILALKLFQTRKESISPVAPPESQAHFQNQCSIGFTAKASAATPKPPTPTPTIKPTATATPRPTTAPIPTATPTIALTPTTNPTSVPATGQPNSCGGTCGSNYNCQGNLFCYQGVCRNPACAEKTDCNCLTTNSGGNAVNSSTQQQAAATPIPTELKESGFSAPTWLITAGSLLLIGLSSLWLVL
jgi:hypothetical protein